jgi:transposase
MRFDGQRAARPELGIIKSSVRPLPSISCGQRVGPCFAPVQIAAAVTGEDNAKPQSEDDRRMRSLSTARNGLIEIDLGNRRRIRVDAQVDPEALARVLDVLERR